jgi:dUTP pyrophosphatase
MKVKIKKLHEDAVIPSYSKKGDAGMDLTAVSKMYDRYGNVSYGTGLAFEIPEGYVGLLFPRSSNCKKDLLLSNSVGVIDSGYRGEVTFKFKPSGVFADVLNGESEDGDDFCRIEFPGIRHGDIVYDEYEIGDRIGQLIILPYPQIEFEEVDELSETERNTGGYGSTGK